MFNFVVFIYFYSIAFCESYTNNQFIADVNERFDANPVENTTVGHIYDLLKCAGLPRLKEINEEERKTASLFSRDLIPQMYAWKVIVPTYENSTMVACRINFYEGPQIVEIFNEDYEVIDAYAIAPGDEILKLNIQTGAELATLKLANCPSA